MTEETMGDVGAFARAILHGDDMHREWLMEAAQCWIDGQPIPEPRSRPAPSEASGDVVEAVKKHLKWMRRFICDRDELDSTTPRKVAINATDAADELEAALSATPAPQADALREAFTAGWRASRLVKTEFDCNNAVAEAWEGYSLVTKAMRTLTESRTKGT